MSINWNNLRPWNGSQQTAFEELCSQLASCEDMPKDSTFIRKGTPDAGVECFWKLPNSKEYAWQAKYFLAPPDAQQWSQIDDSVENALAKHPHLIKYIICLPLDRPDARIESKKSCLDKWNDHVEKWNEWATVKNMQVDFEYWGTSEIFERLSQEKHHGRYLFWFDSEMLTLQKMLRQIDETIANVGPKYTPDLNIHLDLAETFEFISRTDRYVLELRKNIGLLQRKVEKLRKQDVEGDLKDTVCWFISQLDNLLQQIVRLTFSATETVDLITLSSLFQAIRESNWECEKKIYNAKSEEYAAKNNKKPDEMSHYHVSEKHDRWLYDIQEARKAVDKLYVFIEGTNAQLSMNPAMLLNGAAGSGKTHILCDISRERINRGLPTVLLLGQSFCDGDLWEQIIKMLSLNCTTKDDLLGILNAAGQASRSRTLLIVDAINESAIKNIWTKNLGGILLAVNRYPWVGIILSIRNTYFEYIVPQHLIQDKKLTVVIHHGFSGVEYKATREFFRYYNIKQPDVPLLNPEFQNPLFLKLFCCGLKNSGKTEVPRGSHNITKVYENFIESVNDKLSDKQFLNYDFRDKIVLKAVHKLAAKMAEGNDSRIPLTEAKQIVNEVLPSDGYYDSLFYYLEKEGIITECIIHSQSSYEEAVQFSYERFSDHLITKYLLETYLNLDSPKSSFKKEPLSKLFSSEFYWYNDGLIEAISIQLPERIGRELIALAPQYSNTDSVQKAFLNSLIWRDPNSINTETTKIFYDYIFPQNYNESMETLITVATLENHPLNAHALHKLLLKYNLPNRDATWSIYLFYQIEENGAVDRLIDWAWSNGDKGHINNNSILLAAKTLAWFLTTSQRYLRDRATKALVNLLTHRIELLPTLIEEFKNVDDPYVQERLFSVAYGCAMRTTSKDNIQVLAEYIYEAVFKDDYPPAHVLLRDYARGVIELALYYGLEIDVCVEKIRPPYKSKWPSDIPLKDELDRLYNYKSEKNVNEELKRLYHRISSSGFSDFNRYVIDHLCHCWTSNRIGEPKKATNKDRYESFLNSLTVKQKRAWDKFEHSRSKTLRFALLNLCDEGSQKNQQELDAEEEYQKAEEDFLKSLGKKKKTIYEDFIKRYQMRQIPEDQYALFDKSIAESYIFKRVLDLGWSPKLHSEFDNNRHYVGRNANKPEKISKKYQWIAYHELLALVCDNFEFKKNSWGDKDTFEGPWQISARDIDPSFVLSRNERECWTNTNSKCWWFPIIYDLWDKIEDDSEWLQNTDDLASIDNIIQVKNEDGTDWLSMKGFYHLQEPVLPEEDIYETDRRDIWYIIKSYLVKKTDIDVVYEWAKTKDFFGDWLPDSPQHTGIFLGEFFWSPAYIYHSIPYYNYDGWTKGREGENEMPKPVHITSESYLHEVGCYDCSIEDSILIDLPTKKIADEMLISWKGQEGEWYDSNGTKIALDPSVRAKGPGCLLIRKDAFIKYLEENQYDVLWTVLGEKNMLGGDRGHENWKGRLIINGSARIINGRLSINTHYFFQSPKQ